MSALGKLVVSLALNHAEYTQGLDKSSQEALKFAQNSQKSFDQASNSTKEFLGNMAGNVAGAVASVIGLNAAFTSVRDSINILDSLDEAAEKTGSAIEDLSRIQKVAKNFGDAFEPIDQAIVKLSKGLAGIDDPSNDAIRALDAINVSALNADGTLRKSADVYIDIARSLQGYADGNEKAAVATALFGKSGAELLPELNNLASGIDSVSAATEQDAKQAALFNDRLALTKSSVNNLFVGLAVDLLPTLNNIAVAVNNSTGSMQLWSVISAGVSFILKGAAIAGRAVIFVLEELGISMGARAAQIKSMLSLDFGKAGFIGGEMRKDIEQNRIEYKEFVSTVLNGEQNIAQAMETGGSKEIIKFQLSMPPAIDATTKSIERQAKAFDIELYKLKQYESDAKRARDITESVATKQERYNQTLEELERLRPHMSVEAYTRALDKAERELQDVGAVNRQVTTEMDQLWVQAGRNIQSTFAGSIFDAFNDGVDGMWRNAKTAVGRILSEFAALKFSQSIGLSSMFSIPGAASASGGIGGTGTSALNLAGMGSSAMGLLRSGLGATSLMSSVGGMLPGSVGSFFGGMGVTGTQAAAQAGASALWGASGASTAASMSASVASFAGPAIAIAAVDQIVRMLAGDKRIGGGVGKVLNFVPVLGPLLNGLFGRGPMKQQGTSLTGEIGAGGFESGTLSTRFKQKGGLFRSDKIDFANVDAVTGAISTDNGKLSGFADDLAKVANDTFSLINETTQQASGSLRKIADDLGISSDSIDNFSYSISILSEKGKMLTDEQIAAEITNITDSLARGLVPQVDELAKRGESAMQTVARLGGEFTTLSDAATILGKSVAESRAFISRSSFEGRTGFVDAAGGIDALNQKVAFFAQNFLSNAEQIAPSAEKLNTELGKLGISADITKDQYKDLVQSYGKVNGVTEETLQALLTLAPAFLSVRDATKAASDAAKAANAAAVNDAFSVLKKSIDAERNRVTEQYSAAVEESNKRIQNVTQSIGKLKTLSDALKSTVDAIRPLGRDQAKQQIIDAISAARTGGALPEADSLKNALGVLGNSQSISFAAGSFEFAREQAKTANLVADLGSVTDSQLLLDERSLAALEDSRTRLDQGFNNEMGRLDSLLTQGQQQIDALNGIDTSIMSLADALRGFNVASASAGGSAVGVSATGIYYKDIRDFSSSHTPDQIYAAAQQYGVTEADIVASGAFTADEVSGYLNSKGLPRFAKGGYHGGGLRLVGERGPEIEATGPSRITSNTDLQKMLSSDEVVKKLLELIGEIQTNNKYNQRVASKLDAVTVQTSNGKIALRTGT